MNRRILATVAMITLIQGVLFPQGEDQFLPSEVKQSTIVTEPVSLNKGFFRLGSIVQYGFADKIFDQDGHKKFLDESTWAKDWSFSILGQYGITDRLQVELLIPYRILSEYHSWEYQFPGQDQLIDQTWNLKGSGIGDMDVYIRYQLLTESPKRPSLVGDFYVTIPTGSKNPGEVIDIFDFKLPTGYGEFDLAMRLQLRKVIYPVSYKIYASYSYGLGGSRIYNATDPDELHFRSGGRFRSGVRVEMLLNDWIVLSNDIDFFYKVMGEKENAFPGELYTGREFLYEGGLVFQIKQFRIAESIGIPVSGKNLPADPYYVLIFQYVF